MIKAGIIGDRQTTAADIYRILINHPDVDLRFFSDDNHVGMPLTDVYPVLIGQTDLTISPRRSIDLSEIDVLFVCTKPDEMRRILAAGLPEQLRVVDLSGALRMPAENHDFVYGLPELNRKAMVRGARRVSMADATAMSIELALLPLAKNLLLNEHIHIVSVSDVDSSAVEHPTLSFRYIDEVRMALCQLQESFDAPMLFTHVKSEHHGITTRIYTQCGIDIEVLRRIYEEYYDDHNFVFIVGSEPHPSYVEGTNKCLLHLAKEGNRAVITTVLDDAIKGAAGGAVHAMNLLFGLHERVGLALMGN